MTADNLLYWDSKTEEYIDENGKPQTKEVKDNEFRAIFLTDEELVIIVNERMREIWEPDKIIGYRTFQTYKQGYVRQLKKDKDQDIEDINEAEAELFQEFRRVIKKHLTLQKQMLFNKLAKEWGRQRYARMIERKYDDRNIRHQIENNHSIVAEVKHIEIPHNERDALPIDWEVIEWIDKSLIDNSK